jgi:organic radical activating enzyme
MGSAGIRPKLTIIQPTHNPTNVSHLPLNEIFYSVQGEGISLGKPAIFIRLNGCDLACSFCDTPQTWKKGFLESPQKCSVPDIQAFIKAHMPSNGNKTDTIVITGGEPLLHLKSPAFQELITSLRLSGFRIEIETAGHIAVSELFRDLIDQWNISPKLSNSHNVKLPYTTTLPSFKLHSNAYLKFVVGTKNSRVEMEEVDDLVRSVAWPNDRVIIMPEGITVEDQLLKLPTLIELACERRYRVIPRLHILAWGNKRGV